MATETPQKVLLIDDDKNDLVLMRRLLESNGYQVEMASSGDEGLKLIAAAPPSCVMVDYRMPGMTGYEVARKIKDDETTHNIPVLILTGASSSEVQVEGLDSGADDFVTKGADVAIILARIRALLRIKAYQDKIVQQSSELRLLYDEVKQKSDKIMALNERLGRDLLFARRVQESLLPPRTLTAPGVEVRASYQPTETLSGDFFDYFTVRDSFLIFLADVSGHGTPAAILTSLLKSYIRTEADNLNALSDFMAELNDFLVTASLPSQYATALLLRYDRQAKTLEFSNAAHPAFILYRRAEGKIEIHEQPGHLLGALPSSTYEDFSLSIGAGDLFFGYSDGLTDRLNDANEFYSVQRIGKILADSSDQDMSSLYDRILEDVGSFAQTEELEDDTAFVLARFS